MLEHSFRITRNMKVFFKSLGLGLGNIFIQNDCRSNNDNYTRGFLVLFDIRYESYSWRNSNSIDRSWQDQYRNTFKSYL